jgi:hypothetical protein
MHSDNRPNGNATTNGESSPHSDDNTETEATQARIEPLAPTDLRSAKLLILGMTYREYQIARTGFMAQLLQYKREGTSNRDLAAACGVTPRDIKFLLLQGQADEESNSNSVR